jgi:hypothetical protein
MTKHPARIGLIVFLIALVAACAPTVERPAVEYRAAPAALLAEIVDFGRDHQPTASMTPFRVENESATSVVLLSEVTGVFPIAPRYTRLTFSVVQRGDVSSLSVIATGHNASDTAERFLLHLASVFQRL